MKRVIILGSTGSVGRSALDVIARHKNEFLVLGLSANSDIGTLFNQIMQFKPRYACVRDRVGAAILGRKLTALKLPTRVFSGEDGISALLRNKSDAVVVAISGSPALMPLLEAIKTTKRVALANKEALVMAGDLIMDRARERNVEIMPVDSEQSAIFQCFKNEDRRSVEKVYLTASGGPLRDVDSGEFSRLTPARVLKHPCWKMGKKITVDSATLMNKGLEFIEAMRLFNLAPRQIEILVHPEAIIHSMVEFIDGVVLAQLALTDMRVPIQYALTYPARLNSAIKYLDFAKVKKLTFNKPDFRKFPCLKLAIEAAYSGGSSACVLNAANEEAVSAFLDKRISFVAIPKVIEKVLARHKVVKNPGLGEILKINNWAMSEAKCFLY